MVGTYKKIRTVGVKSIRTVNNFDKNIVEYRLSTNVKKHYHRKGTGYVFPLWKYQETSKKVQKCVRDKYSHSYGLVGKINETYLISERKNRCA